MSGMVFLVGAGPGDPELLTLKGRRVLETADVVVHDRLVAPALLELLGPGALRINVGKTAGGPSTPQAGITDLLVRLGRAGRTVVRLKGGDPFVFGRGGEEAAHCRAQRVPFEIVCGVTSAFSVPAYAGIPVTQRDVAQHVTVVTASGGESGEDDPDYAWLARSSGTVVLLMGLRRVEHVARRLVEEGASPDRPVAVISRGTSADQRTVVGTLATIASDVAAVELLSPAVIVVGDVVRLREQLEWFERRPLFGRKITVTRARAQASELAVTLRALGADVVEAPTIRIEPLDPAQLDDEIHDIADRDFVLFTSRNGAEIFFERLALSGRDARALGGVRVAVVGAGTAEVCTDNGIVPDVVPPLSHRTSAGLLDALSHEPLYGASMLVVRAESGDDTLLEGLRARDVNLRVLPVYRTVVDVLPEPTLRVVCESDVVTFTSASTVRNLASLLSDDARKPPAVTIGPVTSAAAREHGFVVVGEASDPTVASLVVAVMQHVQRDGAPSDGA